ncbi:hypothetical protein QJS10_CPB15g01378 [Acorus calamus]|uniref:Uncharacterized protein n=1 Tax=Acorus calamus TaxID=4465 RepID=A0AAV9D8W8_ACOCL|nr:hypothetical protein QJS10_CPB15g01378 [Acorus calamus]
MRPRRSYQKYSITNSKTVNDADDKSDLLQRVRSGIYLNKKEMEFSYGWEQSKVRLRIECRTIQSTKKKCIWILRNLRANGRSYWLENSIQGTPREGSHSF